jgi:hypothetical protein
VLHEIDTRIRDVSFFRQRKRDNRVPQGVQGSRCAHRAARASKWTTFQLLTSDPNVPWNYLTFRTVKPNEISERYFRVRTVNDNGVTEGSGAFTLVTSMTFP